MSGGEILFGLPAAFEATTAGTALLAPATTGLIGTGGAFTFGQAAMTGLGALGALGSIAGGAQQADIARANAKRAEAEAAYNADQKRRQTTALISSQKAAYGASGAVVGEGSPVEVLASTAAEGELDALSILYGGRSEADISRRKATSSMTSGFTGAGTSLLQTGLSLARA